MDCSIPGFPSITNSWSLLKFISIKLVMPANSLIHCHPLLLLPSIFPSIRVFSNESALHIRYPKYWSFASASVLPMNIQDLFILGLTGLISLQSRGLSRVFSSTTVQKHQFFSTQLSMLICIHVSQEACKVVWYSHFFKNFPQFAVIYIVKGFGMVSRAKVDVFLELSCSFNDPADVDNLISGSSVFSKSSLNIWNFSVQVLLKPLLENFQHYFASM